MADYERSTTVGVAPAAAFAFLSDPRHLPDYVATMRHEGSDAESGELATEAEAAGRGQSGQVRFFADPATRRVEWARSGADYEGWVRVAEGDTGGSAQVTVHLHTRDNSGGPEVDRLLDQTLRNIGRRLSGR